MNGIFHTISSTVTLTTGNYIPCQRTKQNYIRRYKTMLDFIKFYDICCKFNAENGLYFNDREIAQDSYDNFSADTWYTIYDFERVCDAALEPYPIYQRIVELKIDGAQNAAIQSILLEEFGKTYSPEYISNLWRHKIPKLIADEAENQFLSWYYTTQEHGTYKKCSRCGQIKLALPKYFSRNKTSKDGLYSICKSCRNGRLGKSN